MAEEGGYVPQPISSNDELCERRNELKRMALADLLWGIIIYQLDGKYELLSRVNVNYMHAMLEANLHFKLNIVDADTAVDNMLVICHEQRVQLNSDQNKRPMFPFLVERGPIDAGVSVHDAIEAAFNDSSISGKDDNNHECWLCDEPVKPFERIQWCSWCDDEVMHANCLSKHLMSEGKCPRCGFHITMLGFASVPCNPFENVQHQPNYGWLRRAFGPADSTLLAARARSDAIDAESDESGPNDEPNVSVAGTEVEAAAAAGPAAAR